MAHRLLEQWAATFRRRLLERLERDNPAYRQRVYNNMQRLYATIRKGDVVLVEGRSHMSRIIRYFSSSHWSHVAYFAGDALIQPDQPERNTYKKRFGEDAGRLIIEAYTDKGVIVDSLEKYRHNNIRICRPYGISEEDLAQVTAEIITNIGRLYDDQNIIDFARLVLTTFFRPHQRLSHRASLGSGNDFQVICSGMIAKAFQAVGYPIVPGLASSATNPNSPYGACLIMRHYTQIMPRDYDLSPNFEIIKFNIIGQPFDYETLWHEKLM